MFSNREGKPEDNLDHIADIHVIECVGCLCPIVDDCKPDWICFNCPKYQDYVRKIDSTKGEIM